MKPRNSGSLTDQPRISMDFFPVVVDQGWLLEVKSLQISRAWGQFGGSWGGFRWIFFGWIVSPYVSWHWPPYVPWYDMIQFWFIVKIISPGFPIWPLGRCKGVKVLGVIWRRSRQSVFFCWKCEIWIPGLLPSYPSWPGEPINDTIWEELQHEWTYFFDFEDISEIPDILFMSQKSLLRTCWVFVGFGSLSHHLWPGFPYISGNDHRIGHWTTI